MLQQTHSVQDQDHQIVHNATPHTGQFLVKILKGSFGVIRNIAAYALLGFHNLVESSEHKNLQPGEYWWDSPETVDKLFKS